MAARSVVTFEFVVYLGRCAKGVLKEIGAHQWRWAIHLVEGIYLVGDIYPLGVVIEFLLAQFGAEYRFKFALSQWFACAWID